MSIARSLRGMSFSQDFVSSPPPSIVAIGMVDRLGIFGACCEPVESFSMLLMDAPDDGKFIGMDDRRSAFSWNLRYFFVVFFFGSHTI